ncbi:MAG TPA: vanadium-dependent haloperoxidase [Vicinamibacterales bacterium]|nr:vanadium-dependent haloperoxidase [Vicinamibacterales bacterium]
MSGGTIGMRGIRRTARRLAALAAVLVGLFMTSPLAHASDAVMEWNQIALAATVTANQGPLPQIRTMAIVHVSVHDAVNAVTREYKTYLDAPHKSWGASADAAAIAAAHRALVGLFSLQQQALNTARTASLAARGLSESDPGIAVGEAAAAAILALRSSDGSAQAQFPYTAPGAGAPGVWVAVGGAPALLPGWGSVAPWVLRDSSQFRPAGPPRLRSRRYARDYNEVKDIGSAMSLTRTAEQTDIARFWLGSPSVIWNGVARGIIEARELDLSSTARAFALLYLAPADASIVCWDAKYTFNFWRPMAAIREGDADGNDDTLGDPTWAPLFPTPPHPEYLSGHTTNSGAMATVLKLLFGDDQDVPVVATSPTNPGFERQWGSFSEGIEEVIDARVYSGIHYRTSDEVGARVGRAIARFVVSQELRPRRHRQH